MRKYLHLVLLLIMNCSQSTASETTFCHEYGKPIVDDHIVPTITDGFDFKGLTLLGSGAIAFVTLRKYDKKVDSHLVKHPILTEDMVKFGNFLAADGHFFIIAGIHTLLDRDKGVPHLESYLVTGTTVEILKNVSHRTRPNGIGDNSFPSGHVAVAVSSATALTYGYGVKAAIPAYSLASVTFISRLQSRKHWLSDSVSGMIIGIFWARSASFHHYKVLPIITQENVSLSLNFDY